MFHKDLSLIIRPPDPSDKGLTAYDKEYVTDAQSGLVYNGKKPTELQEKPAADTPLYSNMRLDTPVYSLDRPTATLGLTVGLVLMVFLVIILLSLVTARSVGLQRMTLTMWSQTFSAFYAFLLFMSLKDLFIYTLLVWKGGPYTLGSSLVLLAEFVVVLQVLLLGFRSWPKTLVALGVIGLYAVSFAAINIFELVMQLKLFTQGDFFVSASMLILGVMAVAVFVGLCTSTRELFDSSLRSRGPSWCGCCCHLFDADTVNSPAWNEWKKQAVRCEDQLAAVTVGFLISQAVEYGILRAMPAHSISFNFHVLLLATASLIVLSICFAILTRSGSDAPPNRFTSVTMNICLMAAAWCLFHATQWQFNQGFLGASLGLKPQSFTASLLVALSLSFIVLLCYVIVCFYSLSNHTAPWEETLVRNFQSLTTTLGFVLGVAWVTCFIASLPALEANFAKTEVSPTIPAAVIVTALVVPVWGAFVLPRTIIGKTVEEN